MVRMGKLMGALLVLVAGIAMALNTAVADDVQVEEKDCGACPTQAKAHCEEAKAECADAKAECTEAKAGCEAKAEAKSEGCGGCCPSDMAEAKAEGGVNIEAKQTPKVAEVSVQNNIKILPQAAAGGGTIKGKVTLDGGPIKRRPNVSMNDECAASHDTNVKSPATEVAEDGGVRWALVWVEGLEGDAPADPVVVDQVGCMYQPYVFGVVVGQEIHVKNSDDFTHNVNCSPELNDEQKETQAKGATDFVFSFELAEENITLKCDIHSWMEAHCFVFEHPYFAVTDAEGNFTIAGLPAGEHTLKIWHPKFSGSDSKATVEEGGTAEANFTLTK